jgi:hypothetical protein
MQWIEDVLKDEAKHSARFVTVVASGSAQPEAMQPPAMEVLQRQAPVQAFYVLPNAVCPLIEATYLRCDESASRLVRVSSKRVGQRTWLWTTVSISW